MRFDGIGVWGIIATVSFRPLRPVFWRAAAAGLACFALALVSRAGEGVRNIEIVPFKSTTMDTNFEQSGQDDLRTLKAWEPTAPHPYQAPAPRSGMLPPPRPQEQRTLSPEQQQLLDRRRNWVFMTPDDYASQDAKDGKDPSKAGSADDKNLTAMERFYMRLNDSEKAAATNRLGKLKDDRGGDAGNALDDAQQNNDTSPFAASPFSSNPDSEVFQSIPKNIFGSAFGPDNTVKVPTPEEVRSQAEQKARLDTYRQLWVNQTPAATPVVSAPATGPIDSAPLFGVSTPAASATFNAVSPEAPKFSSSRQQITQPAVVVPRVSTPPHSDFIAPQRPF